MVLERAIELAFEITEYDKAKKLVEALDQAASATYAQDGRITAVINGVVHYLDAPTLLLNDMHERGILRSAARLYLDALGERLGEEFGIIIEDQPAEPRRESGVE